MNILLVGFGSIAKKHLESCLRVAPENTYYIHTRTPSSAEDFLSTKVKLASKAELSTLTFELVFICTPTATHLETLEALKIKNGLCIFIEKPLASQTADVEKIQSFVKKNDLKFLYGCILRFHPLIERMQEIISSKKYGEALSYFSTCGSYLPHWRKNSDYKKGYSANKSLGGGVALDLIHEFDYLEYWFGEIKNFSGFKAKVSSLEIDSEDTCLVSAVHQNKTIGQVSLNYYRPLPKRTFEVCFENTVITGDLITGELNIQTKTNADSTEFSSLKEKHVTNSQELHDRQTRFIFESLKGTTKNFWNIENAARLNRKVIEISELKD